MAGATGPTGASAATPETLTLLSDNFGSFGSPAWTDQPAALTELFGTTVGRLKADLDVSCPGPADRERGDRGSGGSRDPGPILDRPVELELSRRGASGPSVNVNTTGLKVSAWVNVTGAAKADVFIRVVSIGGNGNADPVFANALLQVK